MKRHLILFLCFAIYTLFYKWRKKLEETRKSEILLVLSRDKMSNRQMLKIDVEKIVFSNFRLYTFLDFVGVFDVFTVFLFIVELLSVCIFKVFWGRVCSNWNIKKTVFVNLFRWNFFFSWFMIWNHLVYLTVFRNDNSPNHKMQQSRILIWTKCSCYKTIILATL